MTSKNKADGAVPKDLGVEIGGPGRAYFDNVMFDNILDSVMEMSAAIWTVRDRQIVLEKILAEKGIEVTDLIEQHTPGDAELAERKSERDELANRIFKSFLRRPTNDTAKDPNAPSLRKIED